MKWISILSLLFLSACATTPQPHTYLKYSGYMSGCADASVQVILMMRPDLTDEMLKYDVLDALCMELYLHKLEVENIKPNFEKYDRNEAI